METPAAALSVARHLWELPTPHLRGVAVSCDGSHVSIRFCWSRAVGSLEQNLVRLCGVMSVADWFGEVSVATELLIVPGRSRLVLVPGEAWAYLRTHPSRHGGPK